MYASTRSGTLGVMTRMGVALFRYGTVLACRKSIVEFVDGIPWLDAKSRHDIINTALGVARKGLYVPKNSVASFCASECEEVMKSFNRAYRRTWARTKKTSVESGLKLRRDMDDPIVFYLVSKHQKPQKAHAPLQGKILVDRNHSAVLKGKGMADVEKEVARYVREHKTISVQSAMGAPWYLISRCNCRHFLIPLHTSTVLGSSLGALNKAYQKTPTHIHRPITDAERAKAYRELCASIYAKLTRVLGQKKATT